MSDLLKPSPQLLIKLGSIIVHFKEWTSDKGHEFDKIALDALLQDDEVIKWLKDMDELALLPRPR